MRRTVWIGIRTCSIRDDVRSRTGATSLEKRLRTPPYHRKVQGGCQGKRLSIYADCQRQDRDGEQGDVKRSLDCRGQSHGQLILLLIPLLVLQSRCLYNSAQLKS
jgi:hypothetical protein